MEEFKTLMNFVPNLEAKTILQLGVDEKLTQVLVEEKSARVVVADSEQKLSSVKSKTDKNVELLDQNMNEINLNNQKFDFVFFTSLLADSNDDKVLDIIGAALKHLSTKGYLFFRESCIGSSSKKK